MKEEIKDGRKTLDLGSTKKTGFLTGYSYFLATFGAWGNKRVPFFPDNKEQKKRDYG